VPKPLVNFAIVLLFVGVFPMPFGFYTLLRFIICGLSLFALKITHLKSQSNLPWIFAILAVLFNPIIPVYLPKELWIIIDISTAVFLISVKKQLVSSTDLGPRGNE